MVITYSLVIFFATLLGAFVGLGGGVIIKPLLDLAGFHTVDIVSFISAFAVFSMAITSTIKHIKSKTKIDFKIVILMAIGSGVGGVLGNSAFNMVLNAGNSDFVKGLQGVILGFLLVISVLYVNICKFSLKIKSPVGIIIVGLFLGFTASFLGVGGGPINVAFLVFFFSMSVKDAAVYSVAIILFSQLTKLISIYADNQFAPYNLKLLLFIIPCAVIGGLIGAILNKKGNEKTIKIVFTVVVLAIAGVNFYNGYSGLLPQF